MNPKDSIQSRPVFWNSLCHWLRRGRYPWLCFFITLSFRAFALSPPLIISPTNGSIVLPGQTFVVTGVALDGAVTRLEFYEDNALIQFYSNNVPSFAWSNSAVGLHTYTIRAVDNQGSAATSSESKVLIAAPDSPATFFPEFLSSAGLNLQGRASVVSNFYASRRTRLAPKAARGSRPSSR